MKWKTNKYKNWVCRLECIMFRENLEYRMFNIEIYPNLPIEFQI